MVTEFYLPPFVGSAGALELEATFASGFFPVADATRMEPIRTKMNSNSFILFSSFGSLAFDGGVDV